MRQALQYHLSQVHNPKMSKLPPRLQRTQDHKHRVGAQECEQPGILIFLVQMFSWIEIL